MTECFTPNDLVRYLYREMDEEESEQLVQALHSDEILMQQYLDMLGTMEKLDVLIVQPSEGIIRSIKQRSKSPGVEKV